MKRSLGGWWCSLLIAGAVLAAGNASAEEAATFIGPALCRGAPRKPHGEAWGRYQGVRAGTEKRYLFQFALKRFGAPTACRWRATRDSTDLSYTFRGGLQLDSYVSGAGDEEGMATDSQSLDVDGLSEAEAITVLKAIEREESRGNPGIDWDHPHRDTRKGLVYIEFDEEPILSAKLVFRQSKLIQLAFAFVD